MEKLEFNFNLELDAEKQKWVDEREKHLNSLTEAERAVALLREQVELNNATKGDLGFIDCNKCLNKGYIDYLDDNNYIVAKECECMLKRRAIKLIHLSGLAESLKDFTFKNYIVTAEWQKDLKSKAMDYVENGKWLLFAGNTGSGKTHLCTAAIGELLKRGNYCLYMPFTQKAAELKQLQYRDIIKHQDLLSSYQQCDILYIDDLFYSEPSKADIEIAFNILDYRVKANKRTLISTERSFAELFAIKESAFSRIYQLCGKHKADISRDIKKNYRLKELKK